MPASQQHSPQPASAQKWGFPLHVRSVRMRDGVKERQIERATAICMKEKGGVGCGDQPQGLSPVMLMNKNPSS